jgi:hypothetical protein
MGRKRPLFNHDPAFGSLDESAALSIPSRAAKLSGSKIVPNLQAISGVQ